MSGVQTTLNGITVSTGEETTGATVGDDIQDLVQNIILSAQEMVAKANLIVSKINNGSDPVSTALTNCINNFLT